MASPNAIAFKEKVVQQLNHVAPVTARGMFGGYGLYTEGVMFGLIAYEKLYFKVDAENRNDYMEAGMPPFIYERHGKPIEMSYCQLPEAVFEDPASLLKWVDKSVAAARRTKKPKKAKKAAKKRGQ